MKKITLIATIFTMSIYLFACAGASTKQKGTGMGAAIGAAGGAILGQVIGKDTESTLIGAAVGTAIGSATGFAVGSYMDKQEEELKAALANSETASIKRTQDVLIATFKSALLFDFDSFLLKPGANAEISKVANVLIKYPDTLIDVEGHTDSKGSEIYNQALSEKRAKAVKDILVQHGVASNRIQIYGYGESQPISLEDALNRRVNIVIKPI